MFAARGRRLPTVAVAAMLTFVVPFVVPALILIAGSVTAYVVYRLCDREFRKIV